MAGRTLRGGRKERGRPAARSGLKKRAAASRARRTQAKRRAPKRQGKATKTNPVLWELSFAISEEAEEAVAEIVADIFGRAPSVYFDAETKVSSARFYGPQKPSTPELNLLENGLQRIRESGLELPEGKVSLRRMRAEDWAESWKRHFRTLNIGDRLVIRPSWITDPPPRDCPLVVLDPGLSFGTGQHPTTFYCLEELVSGRKEGTRQSFLDIGSGSGILAISAAKLGYAPVDAHEIDPDAVRIAQANVVSNRVGDRVKIRCSDLLKMQSAKRYDVICANLIFDLLIEAGARLIGFLKPEGLLVLAGILRSQFERVAAHYRAMGMVLIRTKSEGEWQSGTFVREDRMEEK